MVATNLNPVSVTPNPASLENGDRLHRREFERRYTASPAHKAELIEGTIDLSSPLGFAAHAEPQGQLLTLLGVYQARFPPYRLGIEPTVRLDNDNEP